MYIAGTVLWVPTLDSLFLGLRPSIASELTLAIKGRFDACLRGSVLVSLVEIRERLPESDIGVLVPGDACWREHLEGEQFRHRRHDVCPRLGKDKRKHQRS